MSFTTLFRSFIKAVKDFFASPSDTPSPNPLTPDEFTPVHSLLDSYTYLSCYDTIFGSTFHYSIGFDPWLSPSFPLFSRHPIQPPPKDPAPSPSAPSSALPIDPDELYPSEPPQTPPRSLCNSPTYP